MKFLEAFVLLFLLLQRHVKSQMSEKQFQSTLKMIGNMCQAKTKVSKELIDAMHQGEFVKDRPLMCYMECCLKATKAIKDGKYDYEGVMASSEIVPLARKQVTIDSANRCKNSGGLSDKCESGLDIYKCIYDVSGTEFYMP